VTSNFGKCFFWLASHPRTILQSKTMKAQFQVSKCDQKFVWGFRAKTTGRQVGPPKFEPSPLGVQNCQSNGQHQRCFAWPWDHPQVSTEAHNAIEILYKPLALWFHYPINNAIVPIRIHFDSHFTNMSASWMAAFFSPPR
jgi:hypothetical protein